MKYLFLIAILNTLAFSGFYTENNSAAKAKYIENERLCKIFTAKVEKYKSDMRDDMLAVASLASYEHRAALFCKKAEEAKKSL